MRIELNVDEKRVQASRYKYSDEISVLRKVHDGEAKNAMLDYDNAKEAGEGAKYLRVYVRKKQMNAKIRKHGNLVFIFREE